MGCGIRKRKSICLLGKYPYPLPLAKGEGLPVGRGACIDKHSQTRQNPGINAGAILYGFSSEYSWVVMRADTPVGPYVCLMS